jgi:hypothetical protein
VQGSAPLLGQVHGVGPSIARVGLTPSKTEPFEIIDDCHHGVAVCSNRLGDPLLRLSLVALKEDQHPEVRRRESKRAGYLGGLGRDVKAQLGQQEDNSSRGIWRPVHEHNCIDKIQS